MTNIPISININKIYSKKIALIISNQEIKEMFDLAKNNIEDWSKVSIVNKGMTKGTLEYSS
jgi:hypothetical protein